MALSPNPIAVCNSVALIALTSASLLDLLKELYGTVAIPEEVYHEVVVRGVGKVGANAVAQAINQGWVATHRVKDKPRVRTLMEGENIHQGEAECIVLAPEIGADIVIMDDGHAYNVAKTFRRHFQTSAIPSS